MFAVILTGSIAGCSSTDEATPSQPDVIQTTPEFTGDIIQVDAIEKNGVRGTFLTKGKDTIGSSDQYIVTVTDKTILLEQAGELVNSIDFEVLQPGQQVRVWFSGPVRESYPAQVDAAQVMMER